MFFDVNILTDGARAEHEERQTERGKQEAYDIHRWNFLFPEVLHEAQGENNSHNAHRDVDEEYPPPTKVRGDEAAYDGARDGTKGRRDGEIEKRRDQVLPIHRAHHHDSPHRIIIAPPMPWTNRATMKNPNDCARPHIMDETMNNAMAAQNTVRLPKRSAMPAGNRYKNRQADQIGQQAQLQHQRVFPKSRAIIGRPC